MIPHLKTVNVSTLIVSIGAPASGKSTQFAILQKKLAQHGFRVISISADSFLKDDTPFNPKLWKIARESLIESASNLSGKEYDYILVEDTNRYSSMRRDFLKISSKVIFVYFRCSLNQCILNCSLRKSRKIPVSVIENYFTKFDSPKHLNVIEIEWSIYSKNPDYLVNRVLNHTIKVSNPPPIIQLQSAKKSLVPNSPSSKTNPTRKGTIDSFHRQIIKLLAQKSSVSFSTYPTSLSPKKCTCNWRLECPEKSCTLFNHVARMVSSNDIAKYAKIVSSCRKSFSKNDSEYEYPHYLLSEICLHLTNTSKQVK